MTSTETPTLTPPASAVTRCDHCGDDVTDGGSFCSDEHAAAWLESPFL